MAIDRGRDVYRMLNLDTMSPIVARDIVWLGKVYGVWKGLHQASFIPVEPQEEEGEATEQEENETNEVSLHTPGTPDESNEDKVVTDDEASVEETERPSLREASDDADDDDDDDESRD